MCNVIKNQANGKDFYFCKEHRVECEHDGCPAWTEVSDSWDVRSSPAISEKNWAEFEKLVNEEGKAEETAFMDSLRNTQLVDKPTDPNDFDFWDLNNPPEPGDDYY